MNLTFGICWIEDQASPAESATVERAVRDAGFEPEISLVASEDKIRRFAEQQQRFQDYELILLDLNLGDGLRGDKLAPSVRDSFRSTPILFYSNEAESSLRLRMAQENVDGVYCTNRLNLAIRVGELVLDLAPSLNRLSGMRGLAARVVAECDHELRQILLHFSHTEDLGTEIVKSLKERVAGATEDQCVILHPISELPELLLQHSISSAILFREVKRRLRNLDPTEEIRAARRSLNTYPQEVLRRRNDLAHALEEKTDEGWRISRPGSTGTLTTHDFQRIRSDFLEHLRRIKRVRQLLVGEEPG